MSVYDLPLVNATLNATATVLLITARQKIKRREIATHKKIMIAAFCTSVAFLICYLIYHSMVLSVPFKNPTWFRPIYLTILFTHVLLAAVVPVLAVITLRRGLKREDPRHKKIAKWTYPIWLYVSVTGVVIYLLLYQIFPQV
jgi:protein SCO1/2/putative membrane protein